MTEEVIVTERLTGRLGRKNGARRVREFVCRHCGETFTATSRRVNPRFCSRLHYWKWMKGKRPPGIIATPETREASRQRMTGENNPMWRGGDSDKERRNSAYKKWRVEVFKRDGFICQSCGYFNGCGEKRRDLNAHRIVPWIDSIELRYEASNGKTLCVPCHIKEHQDRA